MSGSQGSFTLYTNRFKNGHTTSINDVAWAPLVGRSFHLIGSCSKDLLIVWKIVVKDIFSSENKIFKEPLIEPILKTNAH